MNLTIINKFLLMAALFILGRPSSSIAYSVLTHEAIIDASWDKTIQPLLIQKYPGVTKEQLIEAHSYAYGGSIAPDMGYFPLGSPFFTNLVHYVRSGDFVNALLDEAHDVNEYAFALGFLSHYMADKYGHLLGTNRCVPIVYPGMMKKYGSPVTYEQDKVSHKRMEFAFDVLQTAKGNYASKAYHDFIGFNVSQPLLERAFIKIYGLDLKAVFKNLPFAIEVFRWSVKSLFPILTKAAWVIKKNEILKLQPTATSQSFRYKMQRANYYQESGRKQKLPGFFTNTLSWLVRVLPKIGALKTLKFKEPGPEAEKLFIQSFDSVLMNYTASFKLSGPENTGFVNIDFDTGINTAPGEYELADVSYGKLIIQLSKKRTDHLNTGLKQNILAFYSTPEAALASKYERIEWKRIARALKRLNLKELSN